MPRFRVQHDFNAEDAVELSVRRDDIVHSEKRPEDGWIEVIASNGAKGFVPIDYLKDYQSPQRSAPASYATTSTFSTSGPAGRRSMSPGGQRYSSPHGDSTFGGGTGGNPQLIDTFMKNELFYKDLLRQRQESMERLDRILGEAMTDVATCKDKNTQLTRKLKDLDALLDKERKKWKDRVDEERLILAQKTNSASTAVPLFVNASPVVRSNQSAPLARRSDSEYRK